MRHIKDIVDAIVDRLAQSAITPISKTLQSIPLFLIFASLLPADEISLDVRIDLDTRYQSIVGFGASDAWNVDFIAKYWTEEQRQQLADWLFSQERDENGNYRGIGLSMWRFNIGAGSAEQGEASRIDDETRRAESFLQADGSYDWNAQAGQQWFLREAHRQGVDTFIAFSNSPPVFFTKNGIAHGDGGYSVNLRGDAYSPFAEFLGQVLIHFRDEGMPFDYLSPVNEPQYDWKSTKQEGSPWKNAEVAKIVREIDEVISREELDTKQLLAEAASWRYLYEKTDRQAHSDQIEAFFSLESPHYIGNLASVPKMLCAHSYWLTTTTQEIKNTRRLAREAADGRELALWQSEYSFINMGRVKDTAIESDWDSAQFIAKVMHYDLTLANVESWSFWTVAERLKKNRFARFYLVRIHGNHETDLKQGGRFVPAKTLWSFGHYSRFVRPGAQRVALSGIEEAGDQLLASAYLHEGSKQLVCVVNNLGESPYTLNFELGDFAGTRLEMVTTDADDSFAREEKVEGSNQIQVGPRSMMTLIWEAR